jgi:histone H3/H4
MPKSLSQLAHDLPRPVFERIVRDAVRRHSGDFMTQRFVIINQGNAFLEIDAAVTEMIVQTTTVPISHEVQITGN